MHRSRKDWAMLNALNEYSIGPGLVNSTVSLKFHHTPAYIIPVKHKCEFNTLEFTSCWMQTGILMKFCFTALYGRDTNRLWNLGDHEKSPVLVQVICTSSSGAGQCHECGLCGLQPWICQGPNLKHTAWKQLKHRACTHRTHSYSHIDIIIFIFPWQESLSLSPSFHSGKSSLLATSASLFSSEEAITRRHLCPQYVPNTFWAC